MAIGAVSAYQAGGETQGTKRENVTTSNQEKMFNYETTDSDKNIELQVEREEDKTARKGTVEVVTRKEIPNQGLVDVAPLDKGVVELATGVDIPNMGLIHVAPANKGLVEIVTGYDLPNMGLKDVAPLNKGLGEIVTGKDLPDMGLKDVAPQNKGLLQVIIDWFKN